MRSQCRAGQREGTALGLPIGPHAFGIDLRKTGDDFCQERGIEKNLAEGEPLRVGIPQPAHDVALKSGPARAPEVVAFAALPAAVHRRKRKARRGESQLFHPVAAMPAVAVKIQNRRDFLRAPRTQIFRIDATAADAGEIQVEAFRKRRLKRCGGEFHLGVERLQLGQAFVPVFIEIRRARVDALVVLQFGKGFIDKRHGRERKKNRAGSQVQSAR
ncbi:MAG: hypothetical protein QM796_09220 [Chthoniobacteraceae bacterium]